MFCSNVLCLLKITTWTYKCSQTIVGKHACCSYVKLVKKKKKTTTSRTSNAHDALAVPLELHWVLCDTRAVSHRKDVKQAAEMSFKYDSYVPYTTV